MDTMRSSLGRRAVVLAAFLLLPAAAGAVDHEVRILMDLDNDAATGCLVTTVDGPFDGVEQILITSVETTSPPPAGLVTEVAVSDCVNPATDTFGPPSIVDSGDWPVGIDNGEGGLDVVETYFPLLASVVPDPKIIRVAVVVTDELGGEQALLTEDGTPGGPAILVDLRLLLEIPTLGEWGLILLALLLAGGSIVLLGRRGAVAAALAFVLLGAGLAWAAPGLDGLIDDWFLQDRVAGNGMVLWAKKVGNDLCFRVDVELLFNTSPTADPQSVTTDEDTSVAITLTGSDPESDPLTFTIVPGSGPDHGTLTGTPPNVTYDPDPDYEGPDSFDFQVEDPSGATDTATVSITVDPVNDPPVVDAATFSVAEDAPVGTSVGSATFTDPDAGQSHTFAITAGNTGGAFAINATTGEITTAAALDFETLDTYSLTVEVTDDGVPVLSGSNTVTVNVTDVDDAPVAVDDTATVTEDDPATAIDVLANDTDQDGGPKAIASATDPANSTVVLTGGSPGAHTGLTYEPDPDYCNDPPGTTPDTFTYTLTPGGDVATVSVTVTCVNDDPVAVDDAATVAEDSGATTIDVQANDTDADGDTNTITAVQNPSTAGGTVLITNAGADLSYQPAADYCNDPPGTTLDTFTYTLSPGGSTATVTVTVTCEDDPPVAVDDAATVAEDSGASAIDVLTNDTDVDAGPKTIASAGDPTNGTVVLTGGSPGAHTGLTYAPDANYCNSPPGTTLDTFTYTLNGGSTATVTVTVTCDDDPPLAVNDSATVAEDSGANTIDVRLNDTDIDGGPMTVTLVQNPSTAGGTVLITNLGADVSYEPAADYCNSPPGTTLDTFTYTLNGGSTATVTVTVTCVNDAPVLDLDADDDKGTGGANYAVAYTEGDGAELLEDPGPDVDPENPIGAIITDVDSTTLVSLTVTLTNLLDSGEELLDADVAAFDPDITKDYDTTTPGVGVLTISSVTPQPIADYVAILRTVTYEHTSDDPDDSAARVVQFVANDGTNDSNTATSTVTLTAIDDDPVAVDDTASVLEDSGATLIDVLANDTDTDGGPMTIASASDPANGTVVVAGDDLSLTYEPDPNYCNDGSPLDTFTYELAPGGDTGTVSVTVTCVNDAPAGTNNTVTTNEETAYVFAAPDFGFTDPNDTPPDSLTAVTITTLPAAGSLTLSGGAVSAGQSIPVADLTAGNLEFTPAANGTGTPYTSFTFQVQDDGGTANSGVDLDPSANTLSINVNNVNDAPAGTDNTVATAEDTQYTFTAADFGFTDPNDTPPDDLAAVRITTLPGAGSLTLSGGGFVAGTEILVGDITAGNLKFSPAANGSGSPYTTFTFQVRDDGGTANGGVDLDGSANTMTVNVTPVNDPPVGADNTVTTDEDVLYTFTTADFPFTDPNDTPANGLASVIITTLPADGSLTLGGAGFVAGTEVTAASITGGQLRFVSDLNEFGTPYTSFTFQVRDDGGTANGGVDLDATPNTLTINVNPVNDPPTFTDASIDYTTAGNTQLRAGEAATGASVAHEQDNLDIGEKSGPSDVDGPGPPFTYSLASGPANGQATVNSDGTFTYEPNAGFHGPTDSFMVIVSDGGTPAGTGMVTVTVTISEMVWYVHDVTGANNPSASDDGRSTNAFDSIAELVGANPVTPDDFIFVFAGNTAATPHSTELVIDDSGVKLHGEGVGLTVPGVGTLVPAGTKPRWVVTTDVPLEEDNAVTVNATAGSLTGVEIRGLDLTGRDNGIDVTATGAFNASVTISDNTIQSHATTGLEGVDVNAGSTGTVTLALSDNSFTTRGSALDFTRTAGTAFVTAFHDNVVSGDSQGAGLVVNGPVTFDANTTTGGIQAVPGGTTVIGQPGNRIGGAGLSLTSVTGALNFANLASGTIGAGDLDVFTDNGAALSASGTGGFDLDVTPNAGVLVATAGPAAVLSGLDANLVLNLLTSTTGSSGVSLTTVSGTFSAPSGSSITKSSGGGTAFSVSSSSATVSYGGTLNVTSGSGVGLSNNTGPTNFTGQLTLNTGASGAFSATGSSGTVTATHADNTLTTTTATALNVNGPDIGAGGLVFRNISANGAPNGIVLQDTGATAGLTVNGTGATDGSGGTIQNISGRGASFINARNITLKNMNLTNTATSAGAPCGSAAVVGASTGCNAAVHLNGVTNVTLDNLNVTTSGQQGINGIDVTGFTLTNSVLSGLGNGADEDGLHFLNMLGTSNITSTSITGSGDDNVNIQNRSSTASTINITGGSFNGGVLGSGLLFGIRDSANTTINVSGVTSDNNFSGGIVADGFDTATLKLDVTSSTITNNNDGIQVSANNGSSQFDIDDNDFIGNDFLAVTLLKAAFSTGGALEGAVRNNNPITVGNGRTTDAISVFQAGGGALEVAITNNTFSYAGTQRVILVQAGQDGNGSLDATITGNAIDIQLDGAGNAVAGVLAQSAVTGPGVTSALCLDIGGAGGLSNTFTHSLGGAIAAGDIRVRQRNDGTVRLPGYAGAATDTGAVVTYLSGRNTVVSTPTATAESTGFAGGAACVQPTLP